MDSHKSTLKHEEIHVLLTKEADTTLWHSPLDVITVVI